MLEKQGDLDKMLWSILICTLKEREQSFNLLVQKLKGQIIDANASRDVELIFFCDNRQLTTGHKRNKLVDKAQGKYISFVDDDDDVSDQYVSILYQKAKQNRDCVAMEGIITMNGKNPKHFIHSLKYRGYFEKNGVYFRPPNHLNVVRKDLIKTFRFPEKTFSEDFDWSMEICKAGVLKTEVEMAQPLYFYKAVSRK